jgi:hypothetical protein
MRLSRVALTAGIFGNSSMTKHAINGASRAFAEALLKMVAPALFPAERRDFYAKAYRLCRSLIEACQRQAGRERCRFKPSRN